MNLDLFYSLLCIVLQGGDGMDDLGKYMINEKHKCPICFMYTGVQCVL